MLVFSVKAIGFVQEFCDGLSAEVASQDFAVEFSSSTVRTSREDIANSDIVIVNGMRLAREFAASYPAGELEAPFRLPDMIITDTEITDPRSYDLAASTKSVRVCTREGLAYAIVLSLLNRVSANQEPSRRKQDLLDRAIRNCNAATSQLIRAEQRYRTLMDLIDQVPFTADSFGSLIEMGEGWEKFLGTSWRSALYDGWLTSVHPDDIGGARVRWRAAFEARTSLRCDLRLGGPARPYKWFRVRAAPTHQADVAAPIWHGTFENVDDVYRVAAEHEQAQAALVQLSRESAMGTIASTLAHELNQPLTSVANYVRAGRRLIENNAPVDDLKTALSGADRAAVRAGEIVRRVRELVANGQVDKRSETLFDVVQEACELITLDPAYADIKCSLAVEPGLNRIMIDRVQIQQVILNLVRNSVEALSGYPTRELALRVYGFDHGHYAVAIADNGPGISAAVASRLFDTFNTTKTSGAGIGLSICRTIVEAHGGRIWHNARKIGCEFIFTLPVIH